jgi:photosystem II stability/assembly factor-like uncharacterized protein
MTRSSFRVLRYVCLLAVVISGCSDRGPVPEEQAVETWRILGPGGGGAQFIPTINPADPKHVFVRCDMTGAYVTEDGGRTWRMFNLRIVVQDFEFDPSNPDTVYASNSGLYRSFDRGRSWELIFPRPEDVTGESMQGDHASHRFVTADGMPGGQILKVRVDPADGRRLWIGVSRFGPGRGSVRVLGSADGGVTWVEAGEVAGRQVLGLFPGSWSGRLEEVTVFTDVTAVRLGGPAPRELELPAARLEVVEGGRGTAGVLLYALSASLGGWREDGEAGRIYLSSDLGETWTPGFETIEGKPLPDGPAPRIQTVAVSEQHPETAYLSLASFPVEEGGFFQRYGGIMKTTDGGRSWDWVLTVGGGEVLSRNFHWGWLLRQLGWLRSPSWLGVGPNHPDVVYGTDSGRTFKSEDGGRNWEQLISNDHPDGSAESRGLDVTTTYGVHFDPYDPDHLFVTYTDIGLFHSFDGGRSWHHAVAGIPRQWRNTCYWLEFDPAVRGRIYSVWSNVHDLPRPKMHRSGNLVNGNQKGGVAVSGDGGRWWELLTAGVMGPDGLHSDGMRPGAVPTHIVLDPESPVEARTLYVTDYGYGVWKSENGGRTWQLKNQGIADINRNCWRITRLPSGRLILLVARGGIEGEEVIPGAMYASDDGAESWQVLALPDRVTAPNDLVMDPSDPNLLYLSCWPLAQQGQEVGGGLYRSEDGGNTWARVLRESLHVYASAVDSSGVLYAGTFNSMLLRSDDRGETWQRLGGYNFKWGHRPVPDPHDPEMLYLTTFGGSVFYGPASGVSVDFEDITNLPPPGP